MSARLDLAEAVDLRRSAARDKLGDKRVSLGLATRPDGDDGMRDVAGAASSW